MTLYNIQPNPMSIQDYVNVSITDLILKV